MSPIGNGSPLRPASGTGMAVAFAALLSALVAGVCAAGGHAPFAAREGLGSAAAAAGVWAADARLVYLENDEDVDDGGSATRWGYLFYSPGLQKARAYSVRDGRIVVAENLASRFEAPPLADGWIDSDAALRAAEEHGGREFRRDHAGRVGTMLLARGTFQDGDPDPTSWTIVYVSPKAPSLFVVVDAARGTVRRSWRG